MSIGHTIKTLRESAGLSQSELARRANMNKGYLSQLEAGLVDNPSVYLCIALCGVLGVTVEELVKGTYTPPEPRKKRTFLLTDSEFEQVNALLLKE